MKNQRSNSVSLEGKNIMIIGASGGLGKALANLLSKSKSNLFLLSRSINNISFAFRAKKIECDVTNSDSVLKAFEALDKLVNQLDIFIFCSGVGLIKDIRDVTYSEIATIIDTNLKGAIYTNQEAFKRMAKRKNGHIVNIISTSGRKARALETLYCASKWGLRGFSDSLRLAGKDIGIRVTSIYP